MAITPLPTPPLPTDTPSEFNTKAFEWVDALDTFTTEANALATAADADASAAAASAAAAEVSATDAENASASALAAANFKGNWSDLTGALNKPASVYHNNVVWMLLNNLANVTTSEPGVTADWVAISAQGGADVQVFSTSGTWTKPDGASFVQVEIWGAGGGGGSGGRNATSTAGSGGGGGGGGGYMSRMFQATDLAATATVVIGSGGTGGASVTSDSTSGFAGVPGGKSSFGSYLEVYGGGAGAKGDVTYGTVVSSKGGTGLPYGYPITTGNGAFGNGSTASPSAWGGGDSGTGDGSNGYLSLFGGCGGGGGGNKSSGNVGTAGGEGGGFYRLASISGGGANGGAFGVNGSNATLLRDGGGGGGCGYSASFQVGNQKTLFGNGIFATSSYSYDYVAISANGTTWSIKTTPRPVTFMVHDGSTFVLLCASDGSNNLVYDVYTTTDFVTFTYKSSKTLQSEAASFSYVNSKYIIGFSNGFISHSTNLTSWTDVYTGYAAGIYGVVYISSRYSIVKSGSTAPLAQYSSDLVTFTNCTVSGSPGQFISEPVSNGSNIAIAGVSGSNAFWKTTDGITWATTTNNVASYPKASYANGYFFATSFGSNATYYYSTDGATWTSVASGGNVTTVAYGASIYATAYSAAGTTVAYSASTHNSTTWTARTVSAITQAGGNGGNGANKGGGGGGGGASLNGYASGAGGTGGNGYCIVYSW